MSHDTAPTPAANPSHGETNSVLYLALTIAAATVASSAAYTSLLLTLQPWAMFMGWVAYFSRRPSPREGAQSLACVLVGLCIGALAVATVPALAPTIGGAAFPLTVFGVAVVVISLRGLPILNNLLGYFIGLITFFASHLEPELTSIARLGGATTLGAAAGWLAQTAEGRVRRFTHA